MSAGNEIANFSRSAAAVSRSQILLFQEQIAQHVDQVAAALELALQELHDVRGRVGRLSGGVDLAIELLRAGGRSEALAELEAARANFHARPEGAPKR